MSRKVIAIARIILNIQLNHLIFVAAAVSALGLFELPDSYLFLWIGTGIVPILLYYWRVKAKRISVFFAGLIVILLVGFLLPLDIVAKILFVGMLLVYSFFTIRKKLSENPESVELVSPIVFVLLIGAMTIKNHIYTAQCHGLAWAYLIGYFLYHFMTVYLNFVTIHEKSASNMPEKELFFHGVKQVGIFTGITIFFASLTSNTDWVGKMISVIGEWIRQLLKKLLAGVSGAIVEESAPKQPIVDVGQEDVFGPVEYSELWLKFQKILEVLYEVLIFVIIAAIIFYGTRFLIRFVRENFTKVGKKKQAKTILSNQDIRESCQTEVIRKEKRSILGFLSYEQRIRTLYRKRVLQEKERIIGDGAQQALAYLTAKECCEKIEAEDLKEIYEKVRYGKKA